jgi:hypothetical protein
MHSYVTTLDGTSEKEGGGGVMKVGVEAEVATVNDVTIRGIDTVVAMSDSR